MSSGSYTLAFSNPPAGGLDLVNQTAPTFIGAQNNNFSVSQTFGAGIVNNGSLSVASTSNFVGKCTFTAQPEFLAGVLVDLSEAVVGTLSVSSTSSLNGGLVVLGSVSLPSSSVSDSALSSNVVLANSAQTISGVKTFSAVPILSGASISTGTIPASSLVPDSITDAHVAPAGIGQSSIASGYVDLSSVQNIGGAKTFTSTVVAPALTCTSLSCSSAVDTGTLSCTSLSCSTLTDTGALTSTTAVHSGLVTCNAGITIPTAQPISLLGNITCSSVVATITPVGGVSSINLGGFTKTSSSISLTATMTALTLTGLAGNQEFDIFVNISSSGVNINKALSSAGVTIYNNLAGNQAAANGSKWWFQGKTLSSTIVYLTISNIT